MKNKDRKYADLTKDNKETVIYELPYCTQEKLNELKNGLITKVQNYKQNISLE